MAAAAEVGACPSRDDPFALEVDHLWERTDFSCQLTDVDLGFMVTNHLEGLFKCSHVRQRQIACFHNYPSPQPSDCCCGVIAKWEHWDQMPPDFCGVNPAAKGGCNARGIRGMCRTPVDQGLAGGCTGGCTQYCTGGCTLIPDHDWPPSWQCVSGLSRRCRGWQ